MNKSEKIEKIISFVNKTFDTWFDDVDEAESNNEEFPLSDINTIINMSLLGDGSIFLYYHSLNDEDKEYISRRIKEKDA